MSEASKKHWLHNRSRFRFDGYCIICNDPLPEGRLLFCSTYCYGEYKAAKAIGKTHEFDGVRTSAQIGQARAKFHPPWNMHKCPSCGTPFRGLNCPKCQELEQLRIAKHNAGVREPKQPVHIQRCAFCEKQTYSRFCSKICERLYGYEQMKAIYDGGKP